MDDREIVDNPEQLSYFYEIKPLGRSEDEIKKCYKEGDYLRWSVFPNYKIFIWPHDDMDHDYAESQVTGKDTLYRGIYNKKEGMAFTEFNLPPGEEIEAIKLVLSRYFIK